MHNNNSNSLFFMSRIKTLASRLHYSVVGYHRFIKYYYPERLEEERPLFPMTVNDLCVYIDYKVQHCLYYSMQKHISVLQHHPDHGEWWKNEVLQNLAVLRKMIYYREIAEAKTATNNGENRGEDIQELLASKSIVSSGKEDDDVDNCMIVAGATKGFMITSSKPTIHKQTTIKSSPAISSKELEKEKSIVPSKRRHSIEKPLSKRVRVKNGFGTINMDVNELANRVSIVPYVTPIAMRPLQSIPRHTTMVTIESPSSSFVSSSSSLPSSSIPSSSSS